MIHMLLSISNIDLIIACVLAVAVITFIVLVFKRIFTLFYSIITLLAAVFLYYFQFHASALIMLACFICGVTLFFVVNAGDLRKYIANPTRNVTTKNDRNKLVHGAGAAEKKLDKDNLYKNIYETVVSLSRSKTGALLTFERKDSLNEVMKTGTIINCPVSAEIIQTIFYEGTRLHDGAIIIRDDTIVAASVYFTPTSKALSGKYGARHRAAIGISEISDSVTVVVSEETGRVSIAYGGDLNFVPLDNFMRVFDEYMEAKR